MAATVALLQHFTHGTVYYIETSYCVHGTVHSFIAHTKSKHFNTRSNHYYGKSLYTLPNQTKRYCTGSCTTRRFYTWLFCVAYSPPPSSGKYIHGGRVGEGRGKKKEKSTTCLSQNQSTILVNCFTLFYNTLYLIIVQFTLYLYIF